MFTLHGSTKKSLPEIAPSFFAGSNGSMDGVGTNTTDSVDTALLYAEGDGVVYIIPQITVDYLLISEEQLLSKEQQQKIIDICSELPIADQYRLATDLAGKKVEVFSNDNDAHVFYKQHIHTKNELGLSHDRLKPNVEFEKNHTEVHYAHCDFDLSNVNTHTLHYILNLFDNSFSSYAFQSIAPGLVLPKNAGFKNYLSFAPTHPVICELPASFVMENPAIVTALCAAFNNPSDVELLLYALNDHQIDPDANTLSKRLSHLPFPFEMKNSTFKGSGDNTSPRSYLTKECISSANNKNKIPSITNATTKNEINPLKPKL
jgi:hypothetical protein